MPARGGDGDPRVNRVRCVYKALHLSIGPPITTEGAPRAYRLEVEWGFRGAPRRPRGKGLPVCGGAGDPRVKPRHLDLGTAARSDRNSDDPKMGVSAAIGGVPRRFPRQRDAQPQRGWRSPRQERVWLVGGFCTR